MFIIDFDDTLFNTTGENSFKQARMAELVKLGISEEVYVESYEKARNHPDGLALYNSERHAKVLAEYGFDEEKVLKALKETTGNDIVRFLFPDAIEFLKGLKSLDQPLILLSLGDAEFQYLKIKGCGIEKYFDRVFMVDKTKADVLRELFEHIDEKDAWFINDKADETLGLLKEFPNLKAVLKKSEKSTEEEYKKSGLPYFETLIEVLNYVKEQR